MIKNNRKIEVIRKVPENILRDQTGKFIKAT